MINDDERSSQKKRRQKRKLKTEPEPTQFAPTLVGDDVDDSERLDRIRSLEVRHALYSKCFGLIYDRSQEQLAEQRSLLRDKKPKPEVSEDGLPPKKKMKRTVKNEPGDEVIDLTLD